MRRVLVTGGSGFIGSAVVRRLIRGGGARVVNVDKLTYAATPEALEDCAKNPDYAFERVDICDAAALARVFRDHDPDAVIHLAAESHVDRSIDGPEAFVQTNVVGTCTLLEASRDHLDRLDAGRRAAFRFLHVSTDEVFGDLGPEDAAFTEASAYDPSSPYSASKAASDHLVRAWARTFGLPAIVTNCSNNYGPWQFPEKLIPVLISRAADGATLPIYGDGGNVRDWLFVEDHAEALVAVLERGEVGATYAIGGGAERSNLALARAVCAIMDEARPGAAPHARLIGFVRDRPGHDRRYAIDAARIRAELGWRPGVSFEQGLRATVLWYLAQEPWWRGVIERRRAGGRLGLAAGATRGAARGAAS